MPTRMPILKITAPDIAITPGTANFHPSALGLTDVCPPLQSDTSLMPTPLLHELDLPPLSMKKPAGTACLRCRERKTKCDGGQPCSFCVFRHEECIVRKKRKPTDPRTILRNRLATLQRRFYVLSEEARAHSRSRPYLSDPSRVMPFTGLGPPSPMQDRCLQPAILLEEEGQVLRTATQYLTRCGVDIGGVITELAFPPERKPHPTVVNSLMLVTTWYTPQKHPLRRVMPPEKHLLAQTQAHLANSLEQVEGLVSHVAASALLALWYLHNGRLLEFHYQSSSTARLAIDCGLHQIDESAIKDVVDPLADGPVRSWGILGLPATEKELKQRIHVFWMVFLIDKAASIISGYPTAFDEHMSDPKLTVTTAYFEDSPDHSGKVNNMASVDDLMHFSQLVPILPTRTHSTPKVNAPAQSLGIAAGQAMTLMSRADRLCNHCPQTLADGETLRAAIVTLNAALCCFTSNIPTLVPPSLHHAQPPPYAYSKQTAQEGFFAVGKLTCAAYVVILKMHRAIEQMLQMDFIQVDDLEGFGRESRKKRWVTARAVAVLAHQMTTELAWPDEVERSHDKYCALAAYCWTAAAAALVEQVVELNRSPEPPSDEAICDLRVALEHFEMTVNAINRAAEVLPHLVNQVEELEKSMLSAREGQYLQP